ncbi:MAG TPA: hypothetical protein VGC20_11760, partial [bacterium]
MGIGGNAAAIGALAMAAAGATAGMPRPIRYTLEALHGHFGSTLVEAKDAATAATELEGRLLAHPDLCRRILGVSGLGSLVTDMADPRHRELIRDFYVLWSLVGQVVDVSQLWRDVVGVSPNSANGSRPLGDVANSFGIAYDLGTPRGTRDIEVASMARLRIPPLVAASMETMSLDVLLTFSPELAPYQPHIVALLHGLVPEASHQGPLLEYAIFATATAGGPLLALRQSE